MNLNELIKKYEDRVKMCELNLMGSSYQEILKDLNQLKKAQLQNLNEVKAYLHSQKVTPEMVAIAMRKIEISILGVDTDE